VTSRSIGFGRRFTIPLYLGIALNPINSSMIAIALVSIRQELGLTAAEVAALVSWSYLASAVAQPTMGKLSIRYGARRVFVWGAVIVLAGGILGSIGRDVATLLGSRLLLGVGTAAAFPTSMALIRQRADSLGVEVPGRVLGGLAIAAQATIAIGLLVGGLLVTAFGWRSVFWANIPLSLICIWLTLRGVPADAQDDRGTAPRPSLDIPGVILFAGATTALLVFLGDLSAPSWWLFGASLALGALLVFRELHTPQPLVDFRMLRSNIPLCRTYARNFMTFAVIYTVLYGFSQWLEETRGLAAAAVGLLQAPRSVVAIALSAVVSRYRNLRTPLVVSAASIVASGCLLLLIDDTTPVVILVAVIILFGATSGLGPPVIQISTYRQSPAHDIAVASGLLRTSTYVGAIFSASLVALTFGEQTSNAGLHALAWVFVAVGSLLVIDALLDKDLRRPPGKIPDDREPGID